MYYILYYDHAGNQLWELVSGEDAMQIRVCELAIEFNLEPENDIIVFRAEDEI